jgi:hypothetical protein
MRRFLAAATVLLFTLATATACGDETEPAADGNDDNVVTIEITFEGDTVEPNGERVEVGVRQPIDLVVEADKPGEIHVHSTPEQSFPYEAGTTTLKLEIAKQGVVDVEAHEPDQVIVQLEVR